MKKLVFTILLLSNGFLNSFAQGTATDFNVNDCQGNSHHLFADLESGKVVVLVWVMPCGSCVGPAKTAFNIVNSYFTSNPGKVFYYLIDQNNNCTGLNNWSSANISENVTKFSNSSISQIPYGGVGMPRVVVAGGKDHKIFFSEIDGAAGDPTKIKTAIDQAISISTSSINNKDKEHIKLNLYPNPTSGEISVNYSLSVSEPVCFVFYNLLGEKVKIVNLERQGVGMHHQQIGIENLPNGIYYLSIETTTVSGLVKFSVIH